ncbi:hypothetical protein KKF82_06460 [Patescibacteria group bacterium]|nr:hypothetical protein [Patescibacteria group bacterium]
MTQYCLVEEGVITDGPKKLPKAWRNITRLDLATDESLKLKGWRPLDTDPPYPEYDTKTQHVVAEYTVNEASVTPAYTVVDYPDMFMTGLWCNVVDAEIVTGPKLLPRRWEGTEMYLLTEGEVNALNWLRYVDIEPEYNEDLQYLTSVDTINKSDVTKTYTVNDYTSEEMVTRIADAKVARKATIRLEAQTFILADYPYFVQNNVANSIYGSDIGDPMKAHIANIITESNACEDAVDACTTLAGIRAVTPTWPEVI